MRFQRAMKIVGGTVLPFVMGIAVLVLVLGWLAGFFEKKIEPSETSAVQLTLSPEDAARIDEVHEVPKEYFMEAVGTLKAATRSEIAARIMAPINEIRVKAGAVVEAGELLVVLDRRDVESRLKQAEAALASAKASHEQAESDFRRDSQMFKKAVIAERDYEQSQTSLGVARANLTRAEEAVSEAQVNLSYTSIEAPQAGKIIDRLAEPGDITRPGVPILVLYDPSSLRLEVPVMENLAFKLKIGDTLTVHIDSLDRDVDVTVDEVVPQAEVASRSFLVKVALPRSNDLYEGMFGRLRIPAGTRRHLCLATDAIQTVGQLQFVDVVKDDGRTLERRFITTGRLGMPGRIEVLSGLEAGERVVLRSSEPREQ